MREDFRSFVPSVLIEHYSKNTLDTITEVLHAPRIMLLKKDTISGVTHVDGTQEYKL